MISNIFDKNIIRILTYFLISPGSRYTRKEIKEKTEMNNIPLDSTLTKLKLLKLIIESKKLYALNFSIEKNKEIFNIISNEYKSFNIPYKIFNLLVELGEKLSRNKYVKSVMLFGSYAKLIQTENSDIAVIIEKKLKLKQQIDKITEQINKINKKIELHFFEEKEMKEKDPVIKDVLRNGKLIL